MTVHPRVCGEHGLSPSLNPGTGGSSPRVRGTQFIHHTPPSYRRFIPACAGNTPFTSVSVYPASVHPRVCGEHPLAVDVAVHDLGSSPRVRGTHKIRLARARETRFIPACAGNTVIICTTKTCITVHPRVCGEHLPVSSAGAGFIGSSPRVRGTQILSFSTEYFNRFIPACAGNTPAPYLVPFPAAVHPRVCGEHVIIVQFFKLKIGSSPRVRGTRKPKPKRQRQSRFIPACAGNTALSITTSCNLPVHPRVCGEHQNCKRRNNHRIGSSPRVRGTHTGKIGLVQNVRFIPACAGNTVNLTIMAPNQPVHPRVCGEHAARSINQSIRCGSSPRVRGTLFRVFFISGVSRFIPACAGNTRKKKCLQCHVTVHPRVCGEHGCPLSMRCQRAGSSPRVRGTRPDPCRFSGFVRFIPACAGNTQ